MNGDKMSRLYVRLILVLGLIVLAAVVLWQKGIPRGLDLKGGVELQYQIRTEGLSRAEKDDIVQRTIDVIRKRVDPQGTMELDIRPRGKDRFYIQLPGMGPRESQRIEDLIRRAGKLRFCLVNTTPQDMEAASKGERVAGHTPFLPVVDAATGETRIWRKGTYTELAALERGQENWMLVENNVRVGGEYLVDPHATEDEKTGLPAVGFSFRGKGKVLFEQLTEENTGRRLAIILDEDLYSAPNIETRISGSGIIKGKFTQTEVRDLVAVLRAGQLPADIKLEWNNTVGAQLGEDSIRAGIRASIVALIVVTAFMALYYLFTGLVADFAVMLNLLLVLGVMAGMQAVLTLPGIAGLVLTLGMAVDANVLINERIREEQARGKTLRLAIRSGYDRAFITIMDSNLTTLITGLILFGVGTGPVRGFAITLSLGILISMFTSVWVTRWIVEALVEKGWLKNLSMIKLFGVPNIGFSRMRHAATVVSAVCILAGLVVFVQRGRDKYDTDLTGGFRAEMEVKKGIPIGEFRRRVNEAEAFDRADVQAVLTPGVATEQAGSPTRFSVRVRELSNTTKLAKMQEDLSALLNGMGVLGSLELTGKPWEFRANLTGAGLSETDLRDAMAAERYTESEIAAITVEDVKASEFAIKFQAPETEEEEKLDKLVAHLLEPLHSLITNQLAQVTIGEITREGGAATPPGATISATGFLPLKTKYPYSTAAVREAIVQDILQGDRPADLRVVAHGADAGAEFARDMAIRGDEDTLKRIARSEKRELKVYKFSQPAPTEVRIWLEPQEGVAESELRQKLLEAERGDLLRAIIPIGVQSHKMLLTMRPLSDEKSAEKIKAVLVRLFQDELAAGAEGEIVASITPADAPAYVDSELAKKQGYRFFQVALGSALDIQTIQSALATARLPSETLVVEGDITSEVAKQKNESFLVKFSGTDEEIALKQEAMRQALIERASDPFRSVEAIGAVVAGEMKNKAILAIFLSWVAIIFYLWFRFGEAKFGLAAVVALIHDVLFTMGMVGVADALSGTAVGNFLGFSDIKINVTMIAAFLTLIGYSVNDTIVVFDRIRENMGGVRRRVDPALVDLSINQTLSRTALTGMTTLMVLVVMYVMGGPVIHGFAFVMMVGILIGTYSSVFIASPLLIGWEDHMVKLRKAIRIVTFRFDERK